MQGRVSIRKQFLNCLANGEPVSGARLSQTLGCSRAAISHQAAVLKKTGLQILAKPGRGYQLRWPLSLLNAAEIIAQLPTDIPLRVYEQLASTNQQLMTAARVADGEACLAELQTAGRGRLGRDWWSAPYRNLLLSLAWNWQQGPAALSGFSLASGVAVVAALADRQLPSLALKWPNDILCQGRKLGGLLVEVRGEAEGPCRVVLGLGLNIHNPNPPHSLASQIIDLHAVTGEQSNRSLLAARLIAALRDMMEEFQTHGFAAFQHRWNALHAYRGYPVTVSGGRQQIKGTALGVNDRGALAIEDKAGTVHHCVGGELSLRSRVGSSDRGRR